MKVLKSLGSRVEEVYSANESINVSAAREKRLDEKSSCKETDYTEAVEKKIEEVKEEDHDEMEEQMMFGFVREESKSTEILNPYSYVQEEKWNW
jgi:predicted thioredoxin/glutaredoxin